MHSEFRRLEKLWKSRAHPVSENNALSVESVHWQGHVGSWTDLDYTTHTCRRYAYASTTYITVDDYPGIVYVKNYMDQDTQRRLVCESLHVAHPPNHTSLDPIMETYPREHLCDAALASAEHRDALRKLRWATIGMQYDWTAKVYLGEDPLPMPPLTSELCRRLVRQTPWHCIAQGDASIPEPMYTSWVSSYEPQAGIVNYYAPKDSLTAHVDCAETDMTSPLVSLSVGLSAIFLVGGPTKDKPPLSLLVHSGDAVILCGPVGRRAFHGVPRVLTTSCLKDPPYADYMSGTRINVNVRRVI